MSANVSLTRLHAEERILVTAHRGNSNEYPENTLLAMHKAVEAGADFIEFDLRSSSDNVPLLLHDRTLLRTADDPAAPEEKTLAEIKKLNASWFVHQRRQSTPYDTKIEVPPLRKFLPN